MTKKTVLEKFKSHKIKKFFDKKWINHLYLFGSYARWENTKKSDLDIIIDYDRDKNKITLFDLTDIENILKENFWVEKVDIVTKKSINFRLKKYIEKDIIQIY